MPCSFPLHHRCRIAIVLAWLALFALMPLAAEASDVSFDDSLQLAARLAPMLQARQAQVTAGEQEAARAAALPDPKLTFGIANLPITGADAFDSGADMMTMKQVGVSQQFTARAKRHARQAVADRRVDQARALSLAEQLAVRQVVAQAWIDVWATEQALSSLQAMREPTRIAVATAKARFAGGSSTASEVLATEASVLELDNQIDAAQAALEVARASLARWLQQPPATLQLSGEPPSLTELPVSITTLLASIDRQQPLLGWSERQAIAEAEVERAIAQKRPDWSLGLSYGQRERTPEGLPRSDMLMVAVAVDLPLFAGNRQDRGIAARRADLDAVAAAREDARLAQTERVHGLLARWQSLRQQVSRHQQQSLPLAADRSRTALAGYAGGGELQPWLQARRDEIDLHVRHARMLGELGQIWASLAYLLPAQEDLP